jgi:hypothetical protein
LKKRTKKLLFLKVKVFWFFFSKKNCFLSWRKKMAIPDALMMGGLTPEHDLVFPAQPANPDMRESTSMWIYEENGRFGFPRFGIEAEDSSWNNRGVHGNFAMAGGRIMNGARMGAAHSPFRPDGRPTILGAGPLACRCIKPFRKWAASWNGSVVAGPWSSRFPKHSIRTTALQ